LLDEKARSRTSIKVEFRRGRERGLGDFMSDIKLTGIVNEQIQMVREMRGADRWSMVICWDVDRADSDGRRRVDEMGIRRRDVRGASRQWCGDSRRGVRIRGRSSFNIYW